MLLNSEEGRRVYMNLINRSEYAVFEKRVAETTDYLDIDNIEFDENSELEEILEEILKKNYNIQFADVLGGHLGYSKRKLIRIILENEKPRATYSDAGALKIGNEDMTIFIPNGCGDGKTEYYVTDKNIDIGNYFTSVEGKIGIYGYDCGEDIVETIEGRFGINVVDGIVIFQRWK